MLQTENDQTTESEHSLTHELEAMSIEVKDLKEKLESASSEDDFKENQDTPSASLPKDQEPNSPEVVTLETILKILKGFADINKRLYKIAEARLAPTIKNSSGNLKGKDSRKT